SAVRSLAAHPGYSATNLQGHTGSSLAGRAMAIGNLWATSADFGARQTLYAVSQDLAGDTFVGPRFGYAGRTGGVGRSPLARNDATAAALWERSERLTGVDFGC
ncbi:MAG TPA: oxidoreductase, partial [Mycolicibacterium fallax]|nr:oxidoreductase [Mycolicibacterium fallax]